MDVDLVMERIVLSKCIRICFMLIFIRDLALALVVPAPLQPKVCPLWADRKWQQMLDSHPWQCDLGQKKIQTCQCARAIGPRHRVLGLGFRV